jgi:hypothetical protein
MRRRPNLELQFAHRREMGFAGVPLSKSGWSSRFHSPDRLERLSSAAGLSHFVSNHCGLRCFHCGSALHTKTRPARSARDRGPIRRSGMALRMKNRLERVEPLGAAGMRSGLSCDVSAGALNSAAHSISGKTRLVRDTRGWQHSDRSCDKDESISISCVLAEHRETLTNQSELECEEKQRADFYQHQRFHWH